MNTVYEVVQEYDGYILFSSPYISTLEEAESFQCPQHDQPCTEVIYSREISDSEYEMYFG